MATDQQDEILERNVENLLTRAHEPPRIDADARARVLERLQARAPAAVPAAQAVTEAGPEPATELGAPGVVPLPRPKARPGVWPGLLALAAILALMWFGLRVGGSGLALEGQVYANESAAPVRVELADGSHALLRGGARIEQLKAREIRLLEGELLLDVVEAREPFVVHTEQGRAVALGTRFSVRAEAERILTAVVRGTVRIENDDGEAVLHAGQQGTLEDDEAPTSALGERLSHTLAWARDALGELDEAPREPVRRGNLVARDPSWRGGEWPLPIRKLVVDVQIENGVARTTIDQTFFNHVNRQLEGVYSFPLPSDAAVSRLAMYVDGKLMEGGIVERQRGRNVYENIVYQRRDPALLEWMKGNEFRVRVFPLPPRTEKRVILSYTQELRSIYGAYRLQVPIPAIDLPVGEVEYRVNVADDGYAIESDSHPLDAIGQGQARYHAQKVEIGDDLLITLREQAPEAAHAVASEAEGGDYLMVRAHPEFTAPVKHEARSWVVLYDTSASRDPQELEAQGQLLRRFVHEMDEDDRVAVMAFDSETRTMPGGFVRVRDVDDAALVAFASEQARVAAGVTNLGRGLDAALGLLAGEQNAPYLLYLGDGSITEGTSDLEALRQRVAQRATFVGVSIGDSVDAHVLDALASASGGLSIELNRGEDLAWRAFEVIAMLNSPRVLDLEVALLDGAGRELDGVDALTADHTLPHGECASVLARGEGLAEGRASAIRLDGTLMGEAWSQTIQIPSPRAGAGYLPRLWAQARVDAWLDDDATAHRDEITTLGMEHFLITPFTSLLVLENEKMYHDFDVKRPDAKGWAHYAAPAEIEVVRDPIGSDPLGIEATGDELLLRDPIQMLQYPQLQTGWNDFSTAMPDGTIGLGGLGLIGAGRGGGGVGEGTIGLGNVRGFGGGGGSGTGYGFGARGASLSSSMSEDLDVADAEAGEGPITGASVLGTDSLADRQVEFKRMSAEVSGAFGKSADRSKQAKTSRSPRSRSLAHQQPMGQTGQWWGGARTRGGGGLYGWYGSSPGVPQAIALHYASDPRLDDLTGFVPGMFGDAYDHARESMLARAADQPEGSISSEARDLVDAARGAIEPAGYALADGSTLSVDASGRFSIERTTAEGLAEQVLYDGENAYALYAELGLAVRRRIGSTSPMLLGALTPWIMPEADHLARWYTVERVGPRTLRLTPPAPKNESGEAATAVEIELDEQSRVIEVRRGEAGTRFEHHADRIVIIEGRADGDDAHQTTLPRASTPALLAPVDEAAWTTVAMPLRKPDHWAQTLSEAEAGGGAWRDAQVQRMAGAAALGDTAQVANAARELTAKVERLRLGELVLAAAGVSATSKHDIDAMLAKADRDDAVHDYVAAVSAQRHSWSGRSFDRAAQRWGKEPGLVGTLARYRAILSNVDYGRASAQARAIEAFVDAHPDATLSYVLVQRASQYVSWNRYQQAADMWLHLAEKTDWKVPALYSAAVALNQRGKYAEAAELFERSFETALAAGSPPIVDWQLRQGIQSGRGEASFQRLWGRWRTDVLASERIADRVAFVAAARQLGEIDEAHRVVATTRAAGLDDVMGGIAMIDQLLAGNLVDDAWLITRRLLERAPTDGSVLDRAATVSELQGRIADAAGYLEAAMKAEAETGVLLEGLRADYRRLMGLHTRLARSQLHEGSADEHRDQALRLAAQWRREDPDNAEIDQLCAALYIDEPARAWRHLSSIIERHPAEGRAYAEVAKALEREGQVRRADELLQRAIEVEPTDPTWRLRRAEHLIALGDEPAARAVLDAIVDGDWQDRFSNIEWQAKTLRKQLER